LLISFTNNPNDCYFALWDGYGIDYKENHPELKTERFTPETLVKDIFLVAPWNSGEQSWLPPYVTKGMWLRHRVADRLERLSWKIRGWL
jgi:hypothetical protein